MSSSAFSGRLSARIQRDYSPVPWSEYFDEAHDLEINNNEHNNNHSIGSFRVYLKNFQNPYAPKRKIGQLYYDDKSIEENGNSSKATNDSKILSHEEIEQNLSTSQQLELYSRIPTLVTLHGGGYSALTWAQFSKHINEHCQCRILAIDLRGHGDSKTTDDNQMDINTLVQDVILITHELHRLCGFPETPKLVLIGHSMGGAIAVKCASKCVESLPSLAGFVIIDVVEGTAKDALPQMLSVIKTRPTKFPSVNNAIEWSVRSGMAKNSDAARVSMPGNLVNIATGHLAIHDIEDNKSTMINKQSQDEDEDKKRLQSNLKKHKFHISVDQLIRSGPPEGLSHNFSTLPPLPRIAALRSGSFDHKDVLKEEKEEDQGQQQQQEKEERNKMNEKEDEQKEKANDEYKLPPTVESTGYSWRTNLAKTQPYWNDWFEGLSSEMLTAPVQGKFLLLAGIDRLDKTLTIGQMQGKFMMKVLPKCGHAVHEDVPEQVASAIGDFLVRNKFTTEPTTV